MQMSALQRLAIVAAPLLLLWASVVLVMTR